MAEEAYIYVLNCLPHNNVALIDALRRITNLLPERVSQFNADIKHLRTYSAKAFVHILSEKLRPQGRKMMARAMEGKLCGYEGLSGKIYCVRLNYLGKIVRVRDVRFVEEQMPDVPDDADNPIYEATFEDAYIGGRFQTDNSLWCYRIIKNNKKNKVAFEPVPEVITEKLPVTADNAITGLPTPEPTTRRRHHPSPNG